MRRVTALQANRERVFLVGELVDKIARVTPEREVVGVRGGRVERRPRAVLIVVQKISTVTVTGACGRAQVMERDVSRAPPTAAGVERNNEGCRLRGAAYSNAMQWIWKRRYERRSLAGDAG
jgi:hypothetical protein